MHRVVVDDAEHRPAAALGGVVQQPEGEEPRSGQRADQHRKPQRTLRQDHAQADRGAGGAHRRRGAHRSPGGTGVVVRADAGVVDDEHHPAGGRGLRSDLGIRDLLPPGHRDGIGLRGAVERPLGGQAQSCRVRPTLATVTAAPHRAPINCRTLSRVHSATANP